MRLVQQIKNLNSNCRYYNNLKAYKQDSVLNGQLVVVNKIIAISVANRFRRATGLHKRFNSKQHLVATGSLLHPRNTSYNDWARFTSRRLINAFFIINLLIKSKLLARQRVGLLGLLITAVLQGVNEVREIKLLTPNALRRRQ